MTTKRDHYLLLPTPLTAEEWTWTNCGLCSHRSWRAWVHDAG